MMTRKSSNRKKSAGNGGPPTSSSGSKTKRPTGGSGGGGGPTLSLPTVGRFQLAAALPVCVLLVSGLCRSFGFGPGGRSDGDDGNRRDGTETSIDDDEADAGPREVAAAFNVHERCTLYYAPSSVPHSGLGVYTTIPRVPYAEIGEPDALINLFDSDPTPSPFKDYVWGIGKQWQIHEASSVSSLPFGLPLLSNTHPQLRNVALSKFEHSAGSDRARDPGAGSFTLYRNIRNEVRERVEAGGEIFHDYGDADRWIGSRYERFGAVPLREQWEEADGIVRAVHSFLSKHGRDGGTDGGTDDGWVDDLWALVRREGEYARADVANAMANKLVRSHPPVKALFRECQYTDSRVSAALPRSVSDLPAAAKSGTARWSLPNSVRSIDWIRDNGRCVDHLRPGPSTIEGAGIGAFAKRPIPRGGIIGSSPLLHVTNNSVLESYAVVRDPNGAWTPGPDRASKQLLWNYCLGHRRSTMVLVPYGPMVNLINHASVRNEGPPSRVPNAEMRWSDHPHHRSEWLDLAVSELENGEYGQGGLQVDYVATTEIEPGDEIFIDYGPNWDRAWTDHVRGWVGSPPGPAGYKSARRLNRERVPVLTEDEQKRERPYPENVQFGCYYVHDSDDAGDDGAFRWEEAPRVWDERKHLHACKILSRKRTTDGDEESSEELYDALVVDRHKKRPDRIVRGLPRRAMTFIDVPYTSDQHLAKAFRHFIELSDEMFPEAWKNA